MSGPGVARYNILKHNTISGSPSKFMRQYQDGKKTLFGRQNASYGVLCVYKLLAELRQHNLDG